MGGSQPNDHSGTHQISGNPVIMNVAVVGGAIGHNAAVNIDEWMCFDWPIINRKKGLLKVKH